MNLIFDIEGNSLNEVNIDTHTKKLSLECDKIWCICIEDLDSEYKESFYGKNIQAALQKLDSAENIIGHNIIAYDIPVLMRLFNWTPKANLVDTCIISKLMYPDFKNHPLGGNRLEDWGKFFKYPKGSWDDFSKFDPEMVKYCERDVSLGKMIYQYQQKWIASRKYEKIIKFEHSVSKVLMKQTRFGFAYDTAGAIKLQQELLLEKAQVLDKLHEAFPPIVIKRFHKKTKKPLKDDVEIFNPGSSPQIAKRFLEKYNWKCPLTEKGKPNIDEKTLKSLKFPEAELMLKSKKLEKLLGQLEDGITRSSNSRDGRIHGSVNAQGAVTGRCTHSQPNVSQVDKDPRIRALWGPAAGDILFGVDLKGLELRMLSHSLSKWDKGKYGKILLSEDIHTYNSKLLGLDKNPKGRDISKTVIYGVIYGAGPMKAGEIFNAKASKAVKITKGREIITKLKNGIKGFNELLQFVDFSVEKYKGVYLLDKRWVPARSKHAALNTLLQGNGAIISKYWMMYINHLINEQNLQDKINQCSYSHDELQFSCKPEVVSKLKEICSLASDMVTKRFKLSIPIDCEVKVGKSWAETH